MFKVRYGESHDIQTIEFEDKERAKEFYWNKVKEIDKGNLPQSAALWENDWLISSFRAKNWR